MQTMKLADFAGLVVGGIHLAIVSYFALVIGHNNLPWIWMAFAVIDFPVSLLTFSGLKAMLFIWGDVVWKEESRQLIYASWPIFVHAFLGSVWWGFVTKYFVRLVCKKGNEKETGRFPKKQDD
jgi:hypothetical protein